jgi:hypothetical protein
MVVFVDLEDESEPPERAPHWSLHHPHKGPGFGVGGLSIGSQSQSDGRENPNRNTITEALGCYPYVTSCLGIVAQAWD